MTRAILIAMLLGYGALASGCIAVAAGAGGAYVYGQHEENKEKRGRR